MMREREYSPVNTAKLGNTIEHHDMIEQYLADVESLPW
jgi:hypothetical protein